MSQEEPDQLPPDVAESDITTDVSRVFQENPVIEVFNKPGNLRILITLIEAAGVPLSVADIAEQADVDRQTFYNNEDLLIEYGLIEQVDKIGNAKRYRVDLEYEPIQALMDLYDSMIDAGNQ